jgi:hypothetical protein
MCVDERSTVRMPREIVPMILNAGMLMLWDIAVGGVGVVTAWAVGWWWWWW